MRPQILKINVPVLVSCYQYQVSCRIVSECTIKNLLWYSQPFIFFLTYERNQKDRALDYTRSERLASDKHSSLLGPFVTYEENKVL
jgi:hypothetical protein